MQKSKAPFAYLRPEGRGIKQRRLQADSGSGRESSIQVPDLRCHRQQAGKPLQPKKDINRSFVDDD